MTRKFDFDAILEFIAANSEVYTIAGLEVFVFTCPICGKTLNTFREEQIVTQVLNHLLTHYHYDLKKAIREVKKRQSAT
ncbi:MAG: hypothetical protein QXJ21_09945 [Thermofilum sp.]